MLDRMKEKLSQVIKNNNAIRARHFFEFMNEGVFNFK
jgi:hypothetical protein